MQKFTDVTQKFFQDDIHFSGAIYGGGVNAFEKFIKLYYNKFDEYLKNEKFIGCDQQIISSVFLENDELINTVFTYEQNKDPWFYLINYYST